MWVFRFGFCSYNRDQKLKDSLQCGMLCPRSFLNTGLCVYLLSLPACLLGVELAQGSSNHQSCTQALFLHRRSSFSPQGMPSVLKDCALEGLFWDLQPYLLAASYLSLTAFDSHFSYILFYCYKSFMVSLKIEFAFLFFIFVLRWFPEKRPMLFLFHCVRIGTIIRIFNISSY